MTEQKSRFARCDEEIEAGRLWRAKEMLQGALSQVIFDDQLLEKYGQVLLAMGDDLEAGRFLFASGSRRPEYAQPIALFLDRRGSSGTDKLLSEMPGMLRRHRDVVGDLIQSHGFAEQGFPDDVRHELSYPDEPLETPTPSTKTAQVVGVSVVLIIVAMFVVGFFTTLAFFLRFII